MSSARNSVKRAGVTAAALLVSVILATATVVVPVEMMAGASTTGGTNGSGDIWAGVSYYWGEWVGSRSDCTWSVFMGNTNIDGQPGSELPVRTTNGVTYRLFMKACPTGHRLVWVPQLPPVVIDHLNSSYLARWLPRPPVRLAPRADRVVVKVGTWFWTDATVWKAVSVTAWIPTPEGPLWVTTTARPVRLVFDPGDGAWGSGSVTCVGPGIAWFPVIGDGMASPLGCDYTYQHSSVMSENGSTFVARLRIVWVVTWRASTGASGSAGELRTTGSSRVTAHEIEGLGIG